MISYKYVHENSQYVDKYSVDVDTDENSYVPSLFDTVRRSYSSGFTYATIGDECIFMQTTGNTHDGLLLAAGEFDARFLPSKYIGRLDNKPSASGLLSAALPTIPRTEINESGDFARNLHHIFGKLVAALIYGDPRRPIIIFADKQNAAGYIKALGLLLPRQFMMKLGFTLSDVDAMYNDVTVINSQGYNLPVGVRVVIRDNGNAEDYSTYASACYVFDVHSVSSEPRDNCDIRSASALISVVDEINITDLNKTNAFMRTVSSAFSNDGSVDRAKLERLVTIADFRAHNDDTERAKRVLSLPYAESDIIDYITAINTVLDGAARGEDDGRAMKLALDAMALDERIENATRQKYNEYLLDNYTNKAYTDELAQIIAADASGDALDSLIVRSGQADSAQDKVRVFELIAAAIEVLVKNDRCSVNNNKRLFGSAVALTDAVNLARGNDGEKIMAEFLRILDSVSDARAKNYVAAILLVSAYVGDGGKEVCERRINAMITYYINRRSASKAFIECILGLYGATQQIAETYSGGTNRLDNFLLDVPFSENEIKSQINKLSLEETLDIESKIYSMYDKYSGMKLLVRDRLFDKDFVSTSITSNDKALYAAYCGFFTRFKIDEQNKHPDIKNYIDSIENAQTVGNDFSGYRRRFVYACYSTLNSGTKSKIANPEKANDLLFGDDLQSRKRVAELTVNNFKPRSAGPVMSGKVDTAFIKAALLGLISLFFVILPSIIISASLGETFLDRFTEYSQWYYFIAPIIVFAMYLAIHYCLRRDAGDKAAFLTIICGVLPTALYALSYLLFYFVETGFVL